MSCNKETHRVTAVEIDELYDGISDSWQLNGSMGYDDDEAKLVRDFSFSDFKSAMAFVNKVADLAESEGHHPDIMITKWRKVRLELTTHAIRWLSENDFIFAAKVDMLVEENS